MVDAVIIQSFSLFLHSKLELSSILDSGFKHVTNPFLSLPLSWSPDLLWPK